MAERTADRRQPLRYLAGGWIFAAGAVVAFAWLTVGPYLRQNFRPLPGEAGITVRDCTAVPSCAPDAVELVGHQLSVLRQARTLVLLSAWSVTLLAVLAVAVTTVLVLRGRPAAAVRPLGALWRIQLGWAVLAVAGHGALLAYGAHELASTPEPARMVTFSKAFDAPFTDVGHLYYLAWLAGVGALAAFLTRQVRQSLPAA